MDEYMLWIVKVVLAHLLTDFVLQPSGWIESRNRKHFGSIPLYLHGLVTGIAVLLLTGIHYWAVVCVITVSHILIDGWKSYRPATSFYFLLDQFLHAAVILACWYACFLQPSDLLSAWEVLNTKKAMVLLTAFVFVTQPAGILIGQLTKKWRDKIEGEPTLGNAGKWIGILERVIILVLVLHQQYGSIGLLIAAKGLLRFNEPNRAEIKTEYLLIGTLISISVALLTGILALKMIA